MNNPGFRQWLYRLTASEAALKFWRLAVPALAILIAFLSLMPKPPQGMDTGWDKANHALAFIALTFGACLAWGRTRRDVLWLCLALLAYGGAIELAQTMVPERLGEWMDWLADAVGIGLGLLLALPLQSFVRTGR